MLVKLCEFCNKILNRKEKEDNYFFVKRRFCDPTCANKAQKGKHWSKATEFKKGHVATRRTITEETRNKIRIARQKQDPPWIGKHHSKEARQRMSKARVGKYGGENHPNWKGGITPENKRLRHTLEYKIWRKAVFERDNYTCQQMPEGNQWGSVSRRKGEYAN